MRQERDIFEYMLAGLAAENRLRDIPDECPEGALNLTTNDYLGLASVHSEWMPEFMDLYGDAAFSSVASRLLASDQKHYLNLENYLSEAYGKDVLLFNSGYHANAGCVSALANAGVTFLSDKLSHASIIDGIRLGKSRFERWKHNDTQHLSKILEKETASGNRCVIVLESVYSMDGDISPLQQVVDLKKKFPGTLIYLDEAHALGVFGERGLGVAEREGLIEEIDIIIGTFGKAVASAGAFIATSPLLKSFFINFARSFIFSTALPPVNVAWTLFTMRKIETMVEERYHLVRLSEKFRHGLEAILGKDTGSRSQIVPLLTGSAEKAVKLAAELKKLNIYALPIRRPTVPPGGERIRFSLNASLSDDDIEFILNGIRAAF